VLAILLLQSSPSNAFTPLPSIVRRRPSLAHGLYVENGGEFSFNNDSFEQLPPVESLKPLSETRVTQLPNGGRLSLVGAGPGDPDLLTIKAYQLLTNEAVDDAIVLADRLVSPAILDLISQSCPVQVARKWPGCAEQAQTELYHWMYAGLRKGKHVIRLKIGDPYVFGRGAEEVLQARNWNVEATVIPGVSSALSAPLLGNVPVTHRGAASQVVFCTGYGRDGTSPDLIQYHPQQTVVFLMAVGRLSILSRRLVEWAGYPSNTPVAIIESAGCPQQRTVTGSLETIAQIAEQHQVKAPATIVVGSVCKVLLESDESGSLIQGLIQNATAIV